MTARDAGDAPMLEARTVGDELDALSRELAEARAWANGALAVVERARAEAARGRELLELIDGLPLADTQAAKHHATATRAEVLERTLDAVEAALSPGGTPG